MFAGKPIIGLAGGIASGKSYVAQRFGELGCLVINSDDLITRTYQKPDSRQTLKRWWGDQVLKESGEVDRSFIGQKVFSDPAERKRLEQFLHPQVNQDREKIMAAEADNSQVLAYVWDTPLLFETGLNRECDAVVFVKSPLALRLAQAKARSGWDEAELARREKLQLPLDKKLEISDYVVENTADAEWLRSQIREILSRILAKRSIGSDPAGSDV